MDNDQKLGLAILAVTTLASAGVCMHQFYKSRQFTKASDKNDRDVAAIRKELRNGEITLDIAIARLNLASQELKFAASRYANYKEMFNVLHLSHIRSLEMLKARCA